MNQSKVSPVAECLLGGTAGTSAIMLTHPLDLLKVRMMLQGEAVAAGSGGAAPARRNVIQMAQFVRASEGLVGFYDGLSAAVARQFTYSSIRFGAYVPAKAFLQRGDAPLSFGGKLLAGFFSGGLGAMCANPFDLVLVRMQADKRLPVAQRRGYANVADGVVRIAREEGVFALWRGCQPTVLRAMLVTAGQLSVYDQSKLMLLQSGVFRNDGLPVQFSAGMIAGFVSAVVTNPVDVVRTRWMNASRSGAAAYSGIVDCFLKTVRTEGPRALYKGFVPNYGRLGPQSVLMLIFYEQYLRLYRQYVA